jgi:plasmid maintenance system antidote protein VapI
MPPVKERALSNFFSPSQNHLILIVGLIALACLTSGMALVLASASLDAAQRWLLLMFLILFPVFGLTISLWLILRHHRKLTVSAADEDIRWQLTGPDEQRKNLNAEVIELAAALGLPKQQIGDLRSAYIVAEDLALRQVEHEAKTPLMRHINIGDAGFDGLLVDHDVVTCIDVTFLVKPDITQEKISSVLSKTEYAVKKSQELRPGTKLKLLLAVVTQLSREEEDMMRSLLIEKFAMTPVDVDIRLMDFEELQRVFSAD